MFHLCLLIEKTLFHDSLRRMTSFATIRVCKIITTLQQICHICIFIYKIQLPGIIFFNEDEIIMPPDDEIEDADDERMAMDVRTYSFLIFKKMEYS